jgi:hypothetical protein
VREKKQAPGPERQASGLRPQAPGQRPLRRRAASWIIIAALAVTLPATATATASATPTATPTPTSTATATPSATPTATLPEARGPKPEAQPSPTPSDKLLAANQLLAAGDAAAAAQAYEALLAEGLESPALHVNLGAARVREGRRGAAVASFLRALRLDPLDADARANLAALRARGGVAVPDPPLLARVVERTPDGAAAAAFLAGWLALFALLALRQRSRGTPRAALLAAAAAAALVAAAGAALVLARDAELRAPRAVVVTDGAGLRDGPEAALRPSRALREGTVVLVVAGSGDAVRIRLPDGGEGFVSGRDLEAL